MATSLAPLLGSFASPATLNVVRVAVAFTLLVVPSVAMGATLPLLARTLSAWDENFGRVLGRLYGWNTLGAVAGALAGELFLVGALGVRGTALVAAGLNLLAAGAAFSFSRSLAPIPSAASTSAPELSPLRTGAGSRRIAAAAFLAGGLLLAYEIVWFRFLLLFVASTSLTFALMLAVVLLGISGGGFAGSVWLHRRPEGYRFAPLVAGAPEAWPLLLPTRAFPPLSDAVLGRWKRFQSPGGDGLSTPIASTVRPLVQPLEGAANLKELLAPRLVESAEHLVVFKL